MHCLRCLGAVMLQHTDVVWALPSISVALAMGEELGPAPMKLCRALEQRCPCPKAMQCPVVMAFSCSPSSGCAASAEDWRKWRRQWGKWYIRLALGSFLSSGTRYQAGCFCSTEGQESLGAGTGEPWCWQASAEYNGSRRLLFATGPWLSFKTSSPVVLFNCSILLLLRA